MAEESLKEKTAKGLFWGGMSNTILQFLGLVFGICLARLLTPGDYGMVAMLMVFSLLAGSIQESGFVNAIAIKKSVTDDDYNSVFWFSILMSFALYAVLFFLAPLIALYNKTPELVALSRYAFLGFVISSFGTAQVAFLFRNMQVKQRAVSTFVASVVSGVVGIAMAACGFAYWGLVTQDICFKLVINMMYWHYSSWRPTMKINFSPVRKMFGFSSKILATNIITQLNGQFLQALLGHFYPRADVGLYSQANKWNTMGYSVVGGMVGSVAQPVLSKVGSERERQQRVFRKILRFTAFLSFPAMFGIALIAPEFIPLALGDKWLPCVPYLQLICISGAFIPLSQLYSNLIISNGRSSIYLVSTVALLVIQLTAMLLLYPYGILTLLYAITLINILWLIVWHFMAAGETGLTFTGAMADIIPFVAVSAFVMLIAQTVAEMADISLARLLLKMIVAAVLYAASMWILRVAVARECFEFIMNKIRK